MGANSRDPTSLTEITGRSGLVVGRKTDAPIPPITLKMLYSGEYQASVAVALFKGK